jgi:hypothetical protein
MVFSRLFTLARWCHISTWLFTVCGDVKIPRDGLAMEQESIFPMDVPRSFFILVVSSVSVIAPDTTRDSGLP